MDGLHLLKYIETNIIYFIYPNSILRLESLYRNMFLNIEWKGTKENKMRTKEIISHQLKNIE